MKFFLFLVVGQVLGHSYVTVPQSRSNQMVTQTGCRPPLCFGPCDAPKSEVGKKSSVKTIRRGDNVLITWPRNNHAGGFIRIAWAPTDRSDSHEAFNKNIQKWTCHEMTCKSSNPADPMGGDQDGGAPGKCTTEVSVPSQLKDGAWTMQWVWVGGSYAMSDYYSCVDYKVEGGTVNSDQPLVPTFQGGDVHNPNENKCMFYNANDVGICKVEPCRTPNLPGKNTGVPAGFDDSGKFTNAQKVNGYSKIESTSPSEESSSVVDTEVSNDKEISTNESAEFSNDGISTNSDVSEDDQPDISKNSNRRATIEAMNGTLVAEYEEIFFDDISGRFSAFFEVWNKGQEDVDNWSFKLFYPRKGLRIRQATGMADILEDDERSYVVQSRRVLPAGMTEKLRLSGTV